MSLTKQEIDALVDELLKSTYGLCRYNVSDGTYTRAGVREAAYLAAGLTAEGERKPERVRAQLCREYSSCALARGTWDGTTFVPDGAE